MLEDAVVIGGGPAGAATAICLMQRGANVTLFDSRPQPTWRIGETLAPSASPFLRAFGIESRFGQEGHLRSYGNCSAWGGARVAETDFIYHPDGFGWQLDRARFELFLLRAAGDAGAHVRRGVFVRSVERANRGWNVRTSAGLLRCHWLIDATGRRAFLSHNLAVRRQTWGRLVSVYAVAKAESREDQDTRTWIESVPDGWWYTALVPDGRRTVAWQTDAWLLRNQPWRQASWLREKIRETIHLEQLFLHRGYRLEDSPGATSAQSARLQHFCGEGWLAVGDAAMSFDPLSGSGLAKALETAERAATSIASAGSRALDDYAEWSEETWYQFVVARRAYYTMEKRWPQQLFWRSVLE